MFKETSKHGFEIVTNHQNTPQLLKLILTIERYTIQLLFKLLTTHNTFSIDQKLFLVQIVPMLFFFPYIVHPRLEAYLPFFHNEVNYDNDYIKKQCFPSYLNCMSDIQNQCIY